MSLQLRRIIFEFFRKRRFQPFERNGERCGVRMEPTERMTARFAKYCFPSASSTLAAIFVLSFNEEMSTRLAIVEGGIVTPFSGYAALAITGWPWSGIRRLLQLPVVGRH